MNEELKQLIVSGDTQSILLQSIHETLQRYECTKKYNALIAERVRTEEAMGPIEFDMRAQAISEGGNDKARDALYKSKLIDHVEYQELVRSRRESMILEADLMAEIKLHRDLCRIYTVSAEAIVQAQKG